SSTGITGLSINTRYFWRMNASNAGGPSPFTDAFSFTTGQGSGAPPPPPPPPPGGTPPPAPTLASPANDARDVSRTPTLSWNASAGATSYHVQVSTSSAFGTLVYDNAAVTGTSVTVSPILASRGRFSWRVSASSAGGTSAFSSVRTFRTTR